METGASGATNGVLKISFVNLRETNSDGLRFAKKEVLTEQRFMICNWMAASTLQKRWIVQAWLYLHTEETNCQQIHQGRERECQCDKAVLCAKDENQNRYRVSGHQLSGNQYCHFISFVRRSKQSKSALQVTNSKCTWTPTLSKTISNGSSGTNWTWTRLTMLNNCSYIHVVLVYHLQSLEPKSIPQAQWEKSVHFPVDSKILTM
jgi:hypothetical protein